MFRRSSRGSIALLWLFVLILPLVACTRGGPAGPVQAYYEALNRGEIEAAMAQFSEKTLRSTSHDKIRAALTLSAHQLQASGGIAELNILSTEVEGDRATITCEVVMANGQKTVNKTAVINEKGRWLLGNK